MGFSAGIERGRLPAAFIAATEEGVRTALQQGRYGWPVTDCTVTMTASQYYPRQSRPHQKFDKSISSVAADFRHLSSIDLSEKLKGMKPPDTAEGDRAQQEVEGLADQVDSTVDKTRETIENLPDNASLTEVAASIAPLLPPIQALITNVSSSLTSLKALGSELNDAFEQADSCERYR